jgi:hypothetical protein
MKTKNNNRQHIKNCPKRKQLKKQAKRKVKKKARKRQKHLRKNLVFRLYKTINHYFPNLYDRLNEIPDFRKKPKYKMAAITMSCIALFMFKEQSRNAMNNERKSKRFRKNFKKISVHDKIFL